MRIGVICLIQRFFSVPHAIDLALYLTSFDVRRTKTGYIEETHPMSETTRNESESLWGANHLHG